MAIRILLELLILSVPIVIFAIYKIFPQNKITIYLIPRMLADQEYPKAKLRKVGIAYLAFGLWLISITISVSYLFSDQQIERFTWLMGLLYFVIPLISVMLWVIGFYYLIIGLFSKVDYIKPRLESIYYTEKAELEKYIRKLKIYTITNLSCLFLFAVLIPIEMLLGIEERGLIILFNVALLITFIMTIWRIRAYIVKSATAMDLSAHKYLLSTLFHPLAIFFIWIHSISLMRKFRDIN